MSNTLPDTEVPVALRASTQLSVRQVPDQGLGSVAPAPPGVLPADAAGEAELLAMPAFAATGLAVLIAGGWVLKRRQRISRATDPQADAAAPEPELQPAAPDLMEAAAPVKQPFDVMAQVAQELAEQVVSLQPQQSFPASLEHSQRHPHWIGVPAQKKLIRALMWVRTVAGGAAILAAIAIVVFWAIEAADLRAGDTGLTKPLLALLLAGWGASWGAGRLANLLHRAFFGRVHPKFDD